MKKINVTIIDPVGLHARPASVVVQAANEFESDITIKNGSHEGNLKSIMNVMAMQISEGTNIDIIANGSDEEKAIEKLNEVLKTNKLI
ncbi:MAG: HPr family phosphocarrier protein [Mycoplasmataceae bacterium]|nr:HPr family phosphocarrier protein [Mycoplasmataceae bacterium]